MSSCQGLESTRNQLQTPYPSFQTVPSFFVSWFLKLAACFLPLFSDALPLLQGGVGGCYCGVFSWPTPWPNNKSKGAQLKTHTTEKWGSAGKFLCHWGGFINQMLRLYTYIKRNVYYAVFRGFKATTWYLFLKGTNLLKYIKVTYSQMFNRVQVWNCRFLPLGIFFIIFRFIVATQVCYCMLLHATACYCMLLHATACYCMLLLSTLHDAIVGACEVVKTSEQKVHLATSVVVFFRASALAQTSPRGAIFIDFLNCDFCDFCVPRPLLKPERLKFWYPSYALAAWQQFPSHFLRVAFSLSTILCACSKVDKTCRWNWMDSPFEQMLYFDLGCL